MSYVLVTGNLGYLGSPVVRQLQERGHLVVGLDTGWFVPWSAETLTWPDLHMYGDIRDDHSAAPDVVVHLAGLSNDPMGDLDPKLTYSINGDGTINQIRMFPNSRHVVASSCAVYGAASKIMDETDWPAPQTIYAATKAFVESTVLAQYYNMAFLRLGTLYGYAPVHRLDTVVNKMVADAIGPDRTISCNGNAWRPLTHVEDAAAAIVQMVESDDQGIYNVVGENLQILDVAHAVRDFTGAALLYYDETNDRRDYRANGDKLRATGWENMHTVAGSLPVLAERTLHLPPGRDYVRLTALKRLIESGYLDQNLERAA